MFLLKTKCKKSGMGSEKLKEVKLMQTFSIDYLNKFLKVYRKGINDEGAIRW